MWVSRVPIYQGHPATHAEHVCHQPQRVLGGSTVSVSIKKCIILRGKFVHTFYLVYFELFGLSGLLCIIGENVHNSA